MFEKINELKDYLVNYRDRAQSGEKKSNNWKMIWQKCSTNFCLFMSIFTLSFFLFFNYSRLFFEDDSPLIDSGVGEVSKTRIGSSNVEIISRKINNDTGYAELLIYIEESSDQVHKEYVAFAGETKKKQRIQTKIQSISENYCLVQLYEVPKNWKEISIDFGYNATEKAPTTIEQIEEQNRQPINDKSQQASFYWDARKSQSTKDLTEKTKEKYLIDVIDIEEKLTKQKQKLLVDNAKKIDEEIKKIEQKIDQEQQELVYKVGKEKDNSQYKIYQLNHDKDRYFETKDSIEKEEVFLSEKLEKLKKRKELIINNQ
ncbi:hypothetical protein C6N01_12970 [Enterococcus faecalis]|uniref:hypothetical protein n=1 Tax=Enterococcus faecalis TaxID=1351 RepID=UPI0013642434|nr:hypothetical protein [Enterococcus faecalis]NBJ47120.1 hypothetical protein [Enterococcus faecalis]